MAATVEVRERRELIEDVMKCPSCLCSTSKEVKIGSTSYQECTYCGNLMDMKGLSSETQIELYQGLQTLRTKLNDADELIDRLMQCASLGK